MISMFMLFYVCNVNSWVLTLKSMSLVIQALLNIELMCAVLNLASLVIWCSSFVCSFVHHSSFNTYLTISCIFILKFQNFNLNIFSKLITHLQIWALFLHLGFKNQWTKFLVCVLCKAKLLFQSACLMLQALMTPSSWFKFFIWCYKDTLHQTPRLDLLYEIVNTHNTKLLV
jgi:hypothetical protein